MAVHSEGVFGAASRPKKRLALSVRTTHKRASPNQGRGGHKHKMPNKTNAELCNELTTGDEKNEAIQDAPLLKLCAEADAAQAKGNEFTNDDGIPHFDKARALMLDKIMPITPVSEDGRRVKAATITAIGYQWPTLQSNVELPDIVVATLLRDLGVTQKTFAYRPVKA